MCNEWKPIDTAPKDGSAILGFLGPMGCKDPDFGNYGVTFYEEFSWMGENGEYYATPNFWMPLPKPPEG